VQWQQNALFRTINRPNCDALLISIESNYVISHGTKPAAYRIIEGRRGSNRAPKYSRLGQHGGSKMEKMTRMYLKARELGKRLSKGQTMTEYALILAAVAIVVFITYEVMGQDISTLVNRIYTALTTS